MRLIEDGVWNDYMDNPPEEGTPGVYVALIGRGVLYVGESSNVRKRIRQHRDSGPYRGFEALEPGGVRWVWRKAKNRFKEESRLVWAYRPAGNKRHACRWVKSGPETEPQNAVL